jgi:hypothetical protein
MLAGTPSGGIDVRRWDGSTFVSAVPLASSGDDAQAHLAEDPTGMLNAVYPQLAVDGQHQAERGKRKLKQIKLAVEGSCRFRAQTTIPRRRAGAVRRLGLALRLRGDDVLAPTERTYRVKVKR